MASSGTTDCGCGDMAPLALSPPAPSVPTPAVPSAGVSPGEAQPVLHHDHHHHHVAASRPCMCAFSVHYSADGNLGEPGLVVMTGAKTAFNPHLRYSSPVHNSIASSEDQMIKSRFTLPLAPQPRWSRSWPLGSERPTPSWWSPPGWAPRRSTRGGRWRGSGRSLGPPLPPQILPIQPEREWASRV